MNETRNNTSGHSCPYYRYCNHSILYGRVAEDGGSSTFASDTEALRKQVDQKRHELKLVMDLDLKRSSDITKYTRQLNQLVKEYCELTREQIRRVRGI